MLERFRLVCRAGTYYTHDRMTGQRTSLKTKKLEKALFHDKNEAEEQPLLNTERAKVFLAAHDPMLVQRTWKDVMNAYAAQQNEKSSQSWVERALKAPALRPPSPLTFSYGMFGPTPQLGPISTPVLNNRN